MSHEIMRNQVELMSECSERHLQCPLGGAFPNRKIFVQFVGVAIFSRLLRPSDFGLLAMATVVTNFAMLLRDMGTSAALVQRDKLTDELVDTVFWANVAFGLALAVVVAGTSTFVASFSTAWRRLSS